MINSITIFLLIALGLISVYDFKYKQIPSIILTGILFFTLMFQFLDSNFNLIYLAFGTLSFIFAWLLYEGGFIGGIADVKIITLIGLMISNINSFFLFVMLVMIFGLIYKLIFKFYLKIRIDEEIPFIPCLFAVYIVLFIIGGFT